MTHQDKHTYHTNGRVAPRCLAAPYEDSYQINNSLHLHDILAAAWSDSPLSNPYGSDLHGVMTLAGCYHSLSPGCELFAIYALFQAPTKLKWTYSQMHATPWKKQDTTKHVGFLHIQASGVKVYLSINHHHCILRIVRLYCTFVWIN